MVRDRHAELARVRNGLGHLRNRALSGGWNAWGELVRFRAIQRGALARMRNRQLSACWNAWLALAGEREIIGGALARLRNRQLSSAWNSWAGTNSMSAKDKQLMRKSAAYMMNRKLVKAFVSWRDENRMRHALLHAIVTTIFIQKYARGYIARRRLPRIRYEHVFRQEESKRLGEDAREKAREDFAAAMRRAAGLAPELRPGRRASLAGLVSGVAPGDRAQHLVQIYQRLGMVQPRRRAVSFVDLPPLNHNLPPLGSRPATPYQERLSKEEVSALLERTLNAYEHTAKKVGRSRTMPHVELHRRYALL